MKLYMCVFNPNNQIISDSYKFNYLYEDTIAQVQSNFLVKGQQNFDIGCGNQFGGASQQENAGGQNQPVKVIDVLDTFKYEQSSFDKANYTTYIKEYVPKVLKHLQESNSPRVDKFKKGAKQFVGWVLKNFNQFTFYTPASYDCDGIIVLSYFKQGHQTPTFLYFIDGLKFIKL